MSKNRVNKTRAWPARVLALLIAAAPLNAEAAAVYQFATNDLTITLHDDLCSLKSEITNRPRRVVWDHKGEKVEGCWGYSEQFSLILLYFADKTATALPAPLFAKLTGI